MRTLTAAVTLLAALALIAAGPVERVQSLPEEKGLLALDAPFHRQVDKRSCGVALLQSVFEYWGNKSLDQRAMLRKYPPNNPEEGYSLGEMKRAALEAGFKAYVVAATDAFLKKQLGLGRPMIAPVTLEFGQEELAELGVSAEDYQKARDKGKLRYNHYLMIIGHGKNGYVVLDPARGIYIMDAAKLEGARAPHKLAALLVSL